MLITFLQVLIKLSGKQIVLITYLQVLVIITDYLDSKYQLLLFRFRPIPVTARSKAWFCGRLLDGTAGSNSTWGMNVRLLRVLCVVR